MKIPIFHRECGRPAFLYEESELIPHALVQSCHAEHLDGGTICEGELIVCDSCGKPIGAATDENLSREYGEALFP